MVTNLNNKRILITAGPTWVPIDNVRVISNTATGKTGILLAEKFARQGCRVTLLLGPGNSFCRNKGVKVIPFRFFDELSRLLKKELKGKHYDVIIQSAAISDYKPSSLRIKKISSRLKTLNLALKPAPKLIDSLRKLSPGAFLVGFKFEPDLKVNKLIKNGTSLLKRSRLDLVVANTNQDKHYAAYLVSKNNDCGPFLSKEQMAQKLVTLIANRKPLTARRI